MKNISPNNKAFTLIELSIVLVIIGLIVGGILVGRDLISAAGIRSQIAQIESYQTAVNTFRGKYGYLPGDIPDPDATRFGFAARGTQRGQGNGDGQIEGTDAGTTPSGSYQGIGETALIWMDLGTARLIPGSFTTASATVYNGQVTGADINLYLPQTKIPNGYLFVWSGGDITVGYGSGGTGTGYNYLSIGRVTGIGVPSSGNMPVSNLLTCRDARAMDQKVDDGFPQTGKAKAVTASGAGPHWSTGDTVSGEGAPDTRATAADALNCYDNGNAAGEPQQYSSVNNGMGVNCSLTFKLQ